MNIKTKLLFGIGILAGMIILLVTLSVVNLQILTATEPDSPVAFGACALMDLRNRWHLYPHGFGPAYLAAPFY